MFEISLRTVEVYLVKGADWRTTDGLPSYKLPWSFRSRWAKHTFLMKRKFMLVRTSSDFFITNVCTSEKKTYEDFTIDRTNLLMKLLQAEVLILKSKSTTHLYLHEYQNPKWSLWLKDEIFMFITVSVIITHLLECHSSRKHAYIILTPLYPTFI